MRTSIGEHGVNLSEGQKQLLSFALTIMLRNVHFRVIIPSYGSCVEQLLKMKGRLT